MVPQENNPEVRELPPEAKKGLKIIQVDHIDDVLAALFKPTAGPRVPVAAPRRAKPAPKKPR